MTMSLFEDAAGRSPSPEMKRQVKNPCGRLMRLLTMTKTIVEHVHLLIPASQKAQIYTYNIFWSAPNVRALFSTSPHLGMCVATLVYLLLFRPTLHFIWSYGVRSGLRATHFRHCVWSGTWLKLVHMMACAVQFPRPKTHRSARWNSYARLRFRF